MLGRSEEYTRWTGPAGQNPGRRPTEDTDALPQAREAKSLGEQSSTRRASLPGRSTLIPPRSSRRAEAQRLDVQMRDEGLTLDEWRRLSTVPLLEAEAAAGAIADLTAVREPVESVDDVMDATGEAMERIAALRAAVAGDMTQAEESPPASPHFAGCSTGSCSTGSSHPQPRTGSTRS